MAKVMVAPPKCPVCDALLPATAANDSPVFPFCSKRCKQIDLARWLDGKYAIVETADPLKLLEATGDFDPDNVV
jgi:endogenous inhibitor of DNA gyrase (YacG/DUF329 family)